MKQCAMQQIGLLSMVSLSLMLGRAAPAAADGFYKHLSPAGVVYTNVSTQPKDKKISPSSRYCVVIKNDGWIMIRPLQRPTPIGRNKTQVAKKSQYDRHISDACKKYGLDQSLVKAVIKAESAFDPEAVSPKGAIGLMQLMPDTSKDLGVVDPYDPAENIRGGTRYLKSLLNRFDNNLVLALAAYNAGPAAVQAHGGIPPYAETQTYVQRVLDLYTSYKQ